MNFSASLSQKFLLVLGGAAVLALVLVGIVFSVLLDRYHRTAAARELKESFELIAADLQQRDRRLAAIAERLARQQDVISIANLLNKYQDPQNYQPLTFDGEKRKLAQLLAERTVTTDHSYAAIYLERGELAAFAYHEHERPTASGIMSYRAGVPLLLARKDTAGFSPMEAPPAIGGAVEIPTAAALPQHAYQVVADRLVLSIALPILRKSGFAPNKTIGVVLVVDILDDHFVEEMSKLVGHNFALWLPGATRADSIYS